MDLVDILISLCISAGLSLPAAFTMYVWFYKDTVAEYLRLFKLSHWFYVEEYFISAKDDPNLTYQKFLMYNADSFVVRLLSCPVCLSAWLGLGLALLLCLTAGVTLWWCPVLALTTAYVSLFQYRKLVKLMEHEK